MKGVFKMFLFNIFMFFVGIWLMVKLASLFFAWLRELIERLKPGNFSEKRKWDWIDKYHDDPDKDKNINFEGEDWYKGI